MFNLVFSFASIFISDLTSELFYKLWQKNLNSIKDSLCLPRDPALATRSLLEEGEYSPRDLLILDTQVDLAHEDAFTVFCG